LKTMLSCFVDDNQNNWDELLPYLAYDYNTSTHATTNCTPYEVVYARKSKIPLDLVMEMNQAQDEEGELLVVKAEQRSCQQCLTRLGRNYYSRLHY
ncbi:Transposon Ty3-I Gag-Pol, partial [Brachionus plicatilis]